LSHIDTVHPIGTAMGENKIRIEGDKLYGPGVYDMKAGAFIAHYAARHLHRSGVTPRLPITFMYVPEEEIGSPYSRRLIEAAAVKAKYVLVTEPARDGGKVVVSRKGVGRFDLKTIGRPSHSGAKHEEGRSAIKEMARLILEIESMTDYDTGVTFNVGQIKGGTGVNVVPRECSIEVDMRVVTPEQGEDYVNRVFALKSSDPDVELLIDGEMNRPPLEATEASMDLFAVARECALENGLDLQTTVTSGGGSDGNFTAAMGIPTIDGMGADGAGAHTLDEYVLISSLVPMSEMWWRLLARLK
jgi:glutamate carboxypeptidase